MRTRERLEWRRTPWSWWDYWHLFGPHSSVSAVTTIASRNWPANQRAIFIPMECEEWFDVDVAEMSNGAGASGGNWDVGVYTPDGRRLASSGPVVQAAANVLQAIAVPIILSRGLYYVGVLGTATAMTMYAPGPGGAADWIGTGMLCQDGLSSLPAQATFASYTAQFAPLISLHPKNKAV